MKISTNALKLGVISASFSDLNGGTLTLVVKGTFVEKEDKTCDLTAVYVGNQTYDSNRIFAHISSKCKGLTTFSFNKIGQVTSAELTIGDQKVVLS
jgi:hypothetical protein